MFVSVLFSQYRVGLGQVYRIFLSSTKTPSVFAIFRFPGVSIKTGLRFITFPAADGHACEGQAFGGISDFF